MATSQLNARELGVFQVHSTTVQTTSALDEVKRALDRFSRRVPSRHADFTARAAVPGALAALSDVQALLVVVHERAHFAQYATTPIGSVAWTLWNDVTSGIQWLLVKCREGGVVGNMRTPVLDWLRHTGIESLRGSQIVPSTETLKARYAELGIESAHTARRVKVVAETTEANVAFLEALHTRTPMSMSTFAALAQFCLGRLAAMVGRELTVRSRQPGARSYLPPEGFTLAEILEASARLEELEWLRVLGATESVLSEWERRSIFGVYAPAFNWLLAKLHDPTLARIAIDLALVAPLDTSCTVALGDEVYVEDVLPSWRLPRIVDAMLEQFVPHDREDMSEWIASLEVAAGLPQQREFLSRAIETPLWPIQWGADMIAYGAPPELGPTGYHNYVQSEILRAYRCRIRDPLGIVHPHPERVEVFQPALELYSDRALLHRPPELDESGDLFGQLFLVLSTNLVTLALLDGGRVQHYPQMCRSFFLGVSPDAATEDVEARVGDMHAVLDAIFPDPVLRLVGLDR